MKLKISVILMIISASTFLTAFFIMQSNEHKECNSQQLKTIDAQGSSILIEKHICKEKYSF